MFKKSQSQDVSGSVGKNLQGGRDVNDNSIVIEKLYAGHEDQEMIDYEIINEIFEYLFKTEVLEIISSDNDDKITNLKEKINLNFSPEGKNDVEKLFVKSWERKNLVENYIEQNSEDEAKIDGLIFRFQECFRTIRKSDTHEIEVGDINIFCKLAKMCIPENKRTDSRFFTNALAIVAYIFEGCYFGKKTNTELEKEQKNIFNE